MSPRKNYIAARTRLSLELVYTWDAAARSLSTMTRSAFRAISHAAKLVAALLNFLAAVSELCGETVTKPEARGVEVCDVR